MCFCCSGLSSEENVNLLIQNNFIRLIYKKRVILPNFAVIYKTGNTRQNQLLVNDNLMSLKKSLKNIFKKYLQKERFVLIFNHGIDGGRKMDYIIKTAGKISPETLEKLAANDKNFVEKLACFAKKDPMKPSLFRKDNDQRKFSTKQTLNVSELSSPSLMTPLEIIH